MITKQKFFEKYNQNSPQNKKREKGSFLEKHLFRNLSLPIAHFFARKGIAVNAVTLTALGLYNLANMILIIPSTLSFLMFFVIFGAASILDSVDGQLARFQGTFSGFGKTLDEFMHTISVSLFVLALAVHFYLLKKEVVYLIFGAFGAISFVFDVKWIEISSRIFKAHMSSDGNLLFKIRRIYSLADEVAFIALVFWILRIIDAASSINIAVIFYAVYCTSSFCVKVIYRFILLLKHTETQPKRIWKW